MEDAMRRFTCLIASVLFAANLFANDAPPLPTPEPDVTVREVRYDGKL